MAKTRESEADQPSAAAVDPANFPPFDLNADQAQAVHGRLADVDPDYAPAGSDQKAQATPRPPTSGLLREGESGGVADIQAESEAAKQANIDAGAAGSGDDTTGRVVKVPEPDGGLEGGAGRVAPPTSPATGVGGAGEPGEVVDFTPEAVEEAQANADGLSEAEGQADAEAEPEDEDEDAEESDDVGSMTVAELQAELDDKAIEYDKYARKAELAEQVRAARGC